MIPALPVQGRPARRLRGEGDRPSADSLPEKDETENPRLLPACWDHGIGNAVLSSFSKQSHRPFDKTYADRPWDSTVKRIFYSNGLGHAPFHWLHESHCCCSSISAVRAVKAPAASPRAAPSASPFSWASMRLRRSSSSSSLCISIPASSRPKRPARTRPLFPRLPR